MLSGELAQKMCLVKRGLLNPPLPAMAAAAWLSTGRVGSENVPGQEGPPQSPIARHGSLAYTASGRVGSGLGLVNRASSIPHQLPPPPQ